MIRSQTVITTALLLATLMMTSLTYADEPDNDFLPESLKDCTGQISPERGAVTCGDMQVRWATSGDMPRVELAGALLQEFTETSVEESQHIGVRRASLDFAPSFDVRAISVGTQPAPKKLPRLVETGHLISVERGEGSVGGLCVQPVGVSGEEGLCLEILEDLVGTLLAKPSDG